MYQCELGEYKKKIKQKTSNIGECGMTQCTMLMLIIIKAQSMGTLN